MDDVDDLHVHSIGDGIQRGLMSPCNTTNNYDDTLKSNEKKWQQRGPVSPWKISEEGKFDSYADYTKYPYPNLCTIKIEMAVSSSLPMKALILTKRIQNNRDEQVSHGPNRCVDSRIYFRHKLD